MPRLNYRLVAESSIYRIVAKDVKDCSGQLVFHTLYLVAMYRALSRVATLGTFRNSYHIVHVLASCYDPTFIHAYCLISC